MNIYVARQPIFDRKMNLYGYELLYRKNDKNFFQETDDNQATASLLANSVLVIDFDELIEGTRGFINFPQAFLTHQLPRLLPQQKIIVEILERVEPGRDVINACQSLKDDGYSLALDDFIFGRQGYEELIQLADLIKVEFSRAKIKDQLHLINQYKKEKVFLAEKVETMQDYQLALAMGYDLFQGYFFSKPVLVNAKEIGFQETSLIRVLKELHRPEPDLDQIAKIIQLDLGLAYKLLRAANTVQYGAKYPIKSIRQALTRLGAKETMQWIHVMLLKGVQKLDNAELVKLSLIRGKMLSLIANETGNNANESDYFITGIFSSLDRILDHSMDKIVGSLPLDQEVKNALLGDRNELRICLDAVFAFEQAQWERVNTFIDEHKLTNDRFMALYLKAIKWQRVLSDQDDHTHQ